ncbi:MAG TPA: MDR family MFS transporter [Beijerinckiaceae bacterium]|jgi:EmrB/QacA subfamily drug resistance transporter|nr:MDR family MFS transporter [Beijerinckiaceae bacterium]
MNVQDNNDLRPDERLGRSEKQAIVIGVLVVMLLAAIDQTIVTPAMPTIGSALGDSEYLPWIITAYLLTATASAPLYGKISDSYGRRPVIAAAVVIFLLGSVISALSPTMLILIVGRAVQGLGGGGLLVLAQTVIGDTVPPRERAAYAGYISATWAIASLAGPLLGGFFAERWHWSLIFWVNIPLGIGALFILAGPLKKLAVPTHRHRLDFVGGLLTLAATTTLMLALTWGGGIYPWLSPVILSLLGASFILWLLFVFWLNRVEEPLIPLEVLRNPIVAAATLACFFGMGGSLAIAVYVPIYLQSHLGLSVAASGVALVAYIMGTTVGSAVIGKMVQHVPRYKYLAVGGYALAAVCLTVLALQSTTASLLLTETLLFVAGFGMGSMFPIGTVTVQNAVDYRHLGVATAVLSFMRNLGSALGVAAVGAIALASGLPGLREGVTGNAAVELATASAFRDIFLAGAVISALAALCFLALKEIPLRATVRGE